jgi:hypothetical protein
MARKTYHRLHHDHVTDHKELDGRYHQLHSSHDHHAMQPHELDGHDHAVPQAAKTETRIPNAPSNRYLNDDPYPMQPATHAHMDDSAKSEKAKRAED